MNTYQFNVIEVETGKILVTFDSPQEAARESKEINKANNPSTRTRVVKSELDLSWMAREQGRVESGHYQRLPWDLTDYPFDSKAISETSIYKLHFAHISRNDATQIAFTKDNAKGLADVQTRMPVKKYLIEFYSEYLSSDQIEFWYKAVFDCDQKLNFASTPEEIEQVYQLSSCVSSSYRGLFSCMSKPADHYDSFIHPVRIYGAGDLKVAYFMDKEEVVSRVLIFPQKMEYGKVYGTSTPLRNSLKDALSKLGYRPGKLAGARLLKIEDRSHPNKYVMPYIDTCSIRDGGDYFLLEEYGDISVTSTKGLCTLAPRMVCCTCGAVIADVDDNYPLNGENYCETCFYSVEEPY